MAYQKKQVLFIGRLLWGGGAEKVMYYLSNKIDKNIFEPHVAYMIQQNNIPIKYDQGVTLYSLEPNHLNIYSAYESIKDPMKLKQKIIIKTPIRFKRWLMNISTFLVKQFQDDYRLSNKHNISIQHIINKLNNITISLNAPLTYSYAINQILSRLREDVIILTFQEEPAVQTWLNQIYRQNEYFMFLCAPESMHIRQMYPDNNRQQIEWWLFSNACRTAKAVSVPNQWMKDDLINNFNIQDDKIDIIFNPIDCEFIIEKSKESIKVEDHILAKKTIFVHMARMDPQKNHTLLIKASKVLLSKYKDFVVLLIGDGSERIKIENLVKKNNLQDNIYFLGELSNPYPYLKIARASLLTSDWEASPLSLVDSMLLGAVPISTDCISGPSDTLGDGRYGLLSPVNDENSFSDAMWRIAMDDVLHQQLREIGMKQAYEYDISKYIDKWQSMFLNNK